MSTMDKVFAGYRERTAVLSTSKNPFAQGIAWVEGKMVPLYEARIPLLDQGFMRSDLTYDVIGVWDGRFFRLDDHLTRFHASCSKLRLRFPLPRHDIRRLLVEMVVLSGIQDAYVEIIVTRGMTQVRGSRPEDLRNNSLYMFVRPYVWVMEPEMQYGGGHAIIARTVRRIPPGSFDPTVKNLMWGDFTRGLFEAQDREAVYPFLTDGDAHLTEGAGYNIVLIKDGVLYTPARGVLEGVTRKSVIDTAHAQGFEVRVEFVPVQMAYDADEMFMCTTAGGVMPITVLDGKPVKDGKVGPITQKIWDGYWAMHCDDAFSFKLQYDQKAKL